MYYLPFSAGAYISEKSKALSVFVLRKEHFRFKLQCLAPFKTPFDKKTLVTFLMMKRRKKYLTMKKKALVCLTSQFLKLICTKWLVGHIKKDKNFIVSLAPRLVHNKIIK